MSLADDDRPSSKLGNRVKKCLTQCDITFNKNTRTWEGLAVSPEEAAKQFQSVFFFLANPKQIPGVRRACLDHIWIYIDRAHEKTVSAARS